MPQFKQPLPLEKLAFNFLVEHVVQYCDEHSYEGYIGRFREGVAAVKQLFREYMPDVIYADFCRRFISEFYSIGENRPPSHLEAALRIMMDEEIAGLTLEGEILHHLLTDQAKRIRRLKTIDWTAMLDCEYYRSQIWDFDLRDLTTLIYPEICTDYDLVRVGSSCSKLRELRIQQSDQVTDDGLRALHSCSRLRIINLSSCPHITDHGINELLSSNVNLEEFNLGRCDTPFEAPCFDVLSRARSSVCPSVRRFALKCASVTDDHLNFVVELFLNLTRLEFYRPPDADLRVLKDLKNLEELDFAGSDSFAFDNIEQLLKDVGRNITVLNINKIGITQKDVDFIFAVCQSMECLAFSFTPRRVVDKLFIPSSRILHSLTCVVGGGSIINDRNEREFYVGLEFGVMLVLESLTIRDFFDIYQIVESMILDHVKFPMLREVGGFDRYDRHLKHIKELAKNNNLNFSIRYQ